jgi:hypothetical protein
MTSAILQEAYMVITNSEVQQIQVFNILAHNTLFTKFIWYFIQYKLLYSSSYQSILCVLDNGSISICTLKRVMLQKSFQDYFSVVLNQKLGKWRRVKNKLDMCTGWLRFDPQQRQRIFPLASCVRISSEAHPASCTMGTRGLFPGGKGWSGHDADH